MNPEYESVSREKDGYQQQGLTRAPSIENLTCGPSNDTLCPFKDVAAVESSSSSSTARRKRPFVRRQQRRGGESHMTLFKAAALASMSSPGCGGDSSPETDDARMTTTRQGFTHLLPMAPPMPELGELSDSEESCRKRIRGLSPSYLAVVEQTSNILGDLCMAGSTTNKSFDESSSNDEDINLCQATNQLKK